MNEKEFKVFNTIYSSQKPLYFRAIVNTTKLAYGTVQGILNKNKSLFHITTEGKNKYFFLKKNSSNLYLIYQIEAEKTRQFLKKHVEMTAFFEKLILLKVPIIIFGSFAKGCEKKDSDLDLLIISEKALELPSYLSTYELHPIYVKPSLINEFKKEALYSQVRKAHIVLNGIDYMLNEVLEWLDSAHVKN